MIYSACLLSGSVSFIWLGWKLLERDGSYPRSNRAYFRGNSHASEKEGWRERGKNVVMQKFREVLRNCRGVTGVGSQAELEKMTSPDEVEEIV